MKMVILCGLMQIQNKKHVATSNVNIGGLTDWTY